MAYHSDSWGNGAPPPQEEGGLQMRPMGLKVHYTFDKDNQERCLARWPHILPIQTIAMETQTIGVVDMGICLQAVTQCSPELAADDKDFAIYATDYSEPDTPLVGQGLLSRELHQGQGAHEPKLVTGRVTKNLLAIFGNGIKETLEVKLKLSMVARMPRNDPLPTPQSLSIPPRPSLTPSVSMVSENGEWNPFSQHRPGASQGQSASPMPMPPQQQQQQLMPPNMQGPPQYDSSFENGSGTPLQEFAPVQMAPNSRPGSVGPNVGAQSTAPMSRTQTPILPYARPSPPAEAPVPIPPAPKPAAKAQSQSRPRSRTSSRPPTGRPRGRPRKRPLPSEGNTSGYEDGTDGDDGPQRPKKRATTTQVTTQTERSNSATFGSAPESLRVAASTAGSLRNFRPVAPGDPSSASHLQEIPRAPTPVPEPRLPGQSFRRPTQLSSLRRQSTTSQSGNGVQYPTHLSASHSFGRDAQSPVDSSVPSPMSDEASPADITSSPPVPRSAMYSAHSSPAPSSPILPPMPAPAPQPDSGFMSGGLDDLPTDMDSMNKLPTEPCLPPPVAVKPKPTRKNRAKKPPQPKPLKIQSETPGPPELLPQTSLYNPPPSRAAGRGKKAAAAKSTPSQVTVEAPATHTRKPSAHEGSAANSPQEPLAVTPADEQATQSEVPQESQPVHTEGQYMQAQFQRLPSEEHRSQSEIQQMRGGSQPQYNEEPQHHDGAQMMPTQAQQTPNEEPQMQQESEIMFDQVQQTSQGDAQFQGGEQHVHMTEQPRAVMPNQVDLAAFEASLNDLPPEWLFGNPENDTQFSQDMGEFSPIEETPSQDTNLPPMDSIEGSMKPPAVPTPIAETSVEPELPSVPASDPVLPPLPRGMPMSEGLHPQTDAVDGAMSRLNKNLVKRQAIRQKLEEAVASGQLPSFCSNCGALQTPTWRKIWKQEHRGVPAYHEYSEKPGHVTAINVLERDEMGAPTLYEIIKKSLGPGEDKAYWTEILLCNPCGIWFSKWKAHRPPEKWEKDEQRLSQTRKKRPSGAVGRSRKGRTKSDAQGNLTSEACLPTDPVGPLDNVFSPDETKAGIVEQNENASENGSGRNRKRLATENLEQGSTHSRASRASGREGSPIDVDDEMGGTRRLLFPSPRKDGEQKVLGEVAVNIVQTGPKAIVITDMESAEKKTARPRDQTPEPMNTDFSDLFGPTPRPSTPPSRAVNNGPFKTPTRPTPSHRPVTRSVSKSMRSTRSINSPSQCFLDKTPTRTPRKTPRSALLRRSPRNTLPPDTFGDIGAQTPLTRSISMMLSEGARLAMSSPSRNFDIDFDSLAPGENSETLGGFPQFDFGMLNTDPFMPSSPPSREGGGKLDHGEFGGSLTFDFSEAPALEPSPRGKRRTPIRNPTSHPQNAA